MEKIVSPDFGAAKLKNPIVHPAWILKRMRMVQ